MLGALPILEYFTTKTNEVVEATLTRKKNHWSSGQHVTVLKTEALPGEVCWDGGGSDCNEEVQRGHVPRVAGMKLEWCLLQTWEQGQAAVSTGTGGSRHKDTQSTLPETPRCPFCSPKGS